MKHPVSLIANHWLNKLNVTVFVTLDLLSTNGTLLIQAITQLDAFLYTIAFIIRQKFKKNIPLVLNMKILPAIPNL